MLTSAPIASTTPARAVNRRAAWRPSPAACGRMSISVGSSLSRRLNTFTAAGCRRVARPGKRSHGSQRLRADPAFDLGDLVPAGVNSLAGEALRLLCQATQASSLLTFGGPNRRLAELLYRCDDGGHLAAQRREIGLELAQIAVTGLRRSRARAGFRHVPSFQSNVVGCTLLQPSVTGNGGSFTAVEQENARKDRSFRAQSAALATGTMPRRSGQTATRGCWKRTSRLR